MSRKPALSEAEGDLLLYFVTYEMNFGDTTLELVAQIWL
jgi:hypothetical protein